MNIKYTIFIYQFLVLQTWFDSEANKINNLSNIIMS